ncbi:hypothetical protein [Deinococcus sp. S9]|uniref:hypothetical protein n=1 Tax=Deinococcus sp. S9 TaxID=2545754 RepID=UPI0010566959|nr:hypothetical protein [Deinococcus sp. S9]TDE87346.1 hypothetical protein E0686_02300 [Deinococcus sp. S9]
MAQLQRLLVEWGNRQQPDYLDENGRLISMATLERELLALKDAVSYKENMRRLATKKIERHAHHVPYIAALLYLLDERVLPVSDLQPVIHLQLGHLYRQLRRGGVIYRAHSTGIGARLREDYHPYKGVVYLDPVSRTLLRSGERVALPGDAKIFKDLDEDAENEGEREEILGLLGAGNATVPVPLLPTKRKAPKRPPVLKWRNGYD